MKNLYRGATILILDEPTAVLPPQETEALFATLRQIAAGTLAMAAAGWTTNLTSEAGPMPSIRIVDVRPLRTSDPALRSIFSHEFAVRVAVKGWALYPYSPGATARNNSPEGGSWRLYLDGFPLGNGYAPIVHTPYLTPGTHWIAAELRNVDQTALRPPI